MKVAIMQPYLFPYIGYFQLINAVDTFVFYDDVHFIKRGWINRNNLLINNEANLFTIPLQDASQNKLINEIKILNSNAKFLKTIESAYKKAPFYSAVIELIERTLNSDNQLISEIAIVGIRNICDYLGIHVNFIKASENHSLSIHLKKEHRLIDICKKENASVYVNPMGGQELYNKEDFKRSGIDLFFIKPKEISYKQFQNNFVPWLSMIDVLMFNSVDEVKKMLNNYELV